MHAVGASADGALREQPRGASTSKRFISGCGTRAREPSQSPMARVTAVETDLSCPCALRAPLRL